MYFVAITSTTEDGVFMGILRYAINGLQRCVGSGIEDSSLANAPVAAAGAQLLSADLLRPSAKTLASARLRTKPM